MCKVTIANAQPSTSRARLGQILTVKCNPAYILKGNNRIMCKTNKKFSSVPTCMLSVPCTADSWTKLDIEHSTTPANLPVTSPTEVTVKCRDNYSTTSVVTCGANGEFSYTGQKPTCHSGSGMYCKQILHFNFEFLFN